MNILAIVKEKAGKAYEDLEFLLECFREVLLENNAPDLAARLPWINEIPEMIHLQFRKRDVQLYSMAFQLLNLVEINDAVQQRRRQADEKGSASVNGLWAQNLQMLKEASLPADEIARLLGQAHIETVLTAHPTEAKRATVLEHQRELYLLLVKRQNQTYSKSEQTDIRNNIKAGLEKLWRTGEIYLEKPDVLTELKNVLHYLTHVFPDVLPLLDKNLVKAWKETGFDEELLHNLEAYPQISFGNWVGGDKDGHPLVTPEITDKTLHTLRFNAFVIIKKHLLKLLKNLSFAYTYAKSPAFFQTRLFQMSEEIGEVGTNILAKNKGEVFRQFVNLMLAKMPISLRDEHILETKEESYSYVFAQDLLADLKILQRALLHYGAKAIAWGDVHEVLRLVQTFGFHLAHLDIRQNSHFHDLALSQLMDSAGLVGKDFLQASWQARVAFFEQELASSRPFTHEKTTMQAEALSVTKTYKVVADFTHKYGLDCIGGLIVSMTRHVADLFAVYLFTREAGLWTKTASGWASQLPVVPLFETIEDLENSADILEAFLSNDFTQRSLAFQQQQKNLPAPQQMIMIGYSDSNKSGGILASTMALHNAQMRLSEVGKRFGVEIAFFHGKGGSISRGAGPVHWFIQALPKGSLQGTLRLTEQGETIAQKYAHKVNASYNLELLMAGTATQFILQNNTPNLPHPLLDVLSKMADDSKDLYEKLIHDEHFIQFFSEATPIDAIEQSKIGSRPSRRSNKRTLADLRAIPWVFAWSQSRFNLTSWYGVGYALEKLWQEQPENFEKLKKALKNDVLVRYILTNIDTSLFSTDEDMMRQYADLVTDETVKTHIFGLISTELKRTREMLQKLLTRSFEERRTQHYNSSFLRASAMDELHLSQISLLRTWREQKAQQQEAEADSTLLSILLTINAIAGALRYTG